MTKCRTTERILPEKLTRSALEKLLTAPSMGEATRLRDRVIMRLMAYGSLRCHEVLRLRLSDIRDGDVYVGRGKSAGSRLAAIDGDTKRMLRLWLERRPSGDSDRLFVTLQGRPLSDRCVRAMVAREAESIGLERPIVVDEKTGEKSRRLLSPHALRYTAACLAAEGVPPGQPEQCGQGSDTWFQVDGGASGTKHRRVVTEDDESGLASLKHQRTVIDEAITKLEAEDSCD